MDFNQKWIPPFKKPHKFNVRGRQTEYHAKQQNLGSTKKNFSNFASVKNGRWLIPKQWNDSHREALKFKTAFSKLPSKEDGRTPGGRLFHKRVVLGKKTFYAFCPNIRETTNT